MVRGRLKFEGERARMRVKTTTTKKGGGKQGFFSLCYEFIVPC